MAKIKAYSLPEEEVKDFEKLLLEIGKVDRWTDSRIILEAVKEYGKRHLPGNPQLILPNYIPEMKTPFSESAKEKLSWGVECEQCQGTGKSEIGSKCHACSGLGRIQNVQ